MFRNHLKIAWRSLRKRKMFSLINILGLALGFSCVLLIYLFVNYHMNFDNFHDNQDRIYRIVTEEKRDETEYEQAVPPGFATAFREDYDVAEKVANIYSRGDWQIDVESTTGKKRFIEDIAFVEPEFFEILNFPLENHTGDHVLDQPNVAYITAQLATKLFPDKNALGETFILENLEKIQIVGILKNLPSQTKIRGDVFISFASLKPYDQFVSSGSWGGINSSLHCYALLRPGQNISAIETNLIDLVAKHRPKSKNVHRYKLQPLKEVHLDKAYGGIGRNVLWMVGILGIFIMLIACINFINISTAQAFTRSKEIGVKKVLGSLKQHLFWQFITETFIISLLAIVIAVLCVMLVLPTFNQFFGLHLSTMSLVTFRFLAFVLVLLGFVAFFAGSYPGVLLARVLPVLALKGKLNARNTGGNFTRKILVTTQFIISMVLIVATVVIGKQINYALTSDLGFDKDAIVMVEIPEDIEESKLEGLQERLSHIPGVIGNTGCLSSPGGAENRWGTSIIYNNRPEPEEFSISAKLGDEAYIKTFGLELLAGRNFYKTDTINEVVVNERLAEKLGLDSYEELLGKTIEVNGGSIKAAIVGVVANFHDQDFQGTISPVFIAPNTNNYGEIAIKIQQNYTTEILNKIQQNWEETFPKFLYNYRFLEDRVAEDYAEEKRFLTLSKLFSGLAIFISCLGLYGMIAFFVGQRKKEVGIRKVLGGKIEDILLLFTKDFMKLILIAGIIATPVAWYAMQIWLEGYTYRIEIEWWFFGAAILAIALIALSTIAYQTIKAATANPVKSLRTE